MAGEKRETISAGWGESTCRSLRPTSRDTTVLAGRTRPARPNVGLLFQFQDVPYDYEYSYQSATTTNTVSVTYGLRPYDDGCFS